VALMKKNILKEKIYDNNLVIGPFLKISDPAIVEIAALSGFDFVIIDREHGPISIENTQNMIRAAEAKNITAIVRVPRNEETEILKVLDIGAHGIEVPQINNGIQAKKLRMSAKYSNMGERGVCCYVRSADYSQIQEDNETKKQYFNEANQETLIIAHIEGLEGIQNLDNIIKEDTIDIIFIGPYDLSQSLGIPGQVHNKEVINEMEKIVEKIKNNNKIAGTFVESREDIKRWAEIGVQYFAYSVDVGIFYDKCREIVSEFQEFSTVKK